MPMPWMARAGAVSLVSTALAAAMILPSTALAATTWKVDVGAQSSDAADQANFFFTNRITIDAGDSITWTSQAGEIHTVTFLGGESRQAPDLALFFPNPSGPGIVANPKTNQPRGGTVFNAATYTNSGLMSQPPVPTVTVSSFTMSFPDDTTPGVYTYYCMVHADMQGQVVVQPKGAPTPRLQTSYDREAAIAKTVALAQASSVAARGLAAGVPPKKDTAGIGQLFSGLGSVAVLRFEPDQKVVRAGQTVTWTNRDPETPHTVTFGDEPSPDPFGNFLPVGEDSAGHATIKSIDQSAHSGFIGAGIPFGTTFSATFTQPGLYTYICALHDDLGMKGTIRVIP
jgi:plastocyanin